MDLSSTPARREPLHVLMCTPDFFKIVDVKNIHMEGNRGNTNPDLFKKQWQSVFDIYKQEVGIGNIDGASTIKGVENCEDMVFCANQSFPWIDEEENPYVILSRMLYPSRQNEVPHFEKYYQSLNYKIVSPPGNGLLEGMGDLIPLPGKKIVFGGYGHRTDFKTLELISQILHCYIITLELVNDEFYHLDTCFIPLDANTALIVKEAFNNEGYEKIKRYFKEVIEVPYNEAAKGFALNAHLVHGHQEKFAVIQQGNLFTSDVLKQKGYKIYEVDTSEFIKSGGSVFCMKIMHY